VVRQGDEIEKMKAYTSGFGSFHHDNARKIWVELVLLYTHLLKANDQYEQALAQLSDVLKVINTLDKEWLPTQATLEYELALLYVDLAAINNNASDKEQAILLLVSAVKSGIADHNLVSWQDIKSNKFSLLKNDLRYQKLTRGR
ncbi:MAG: hypothetical protein O6945_01885, partial [Gammaproteobacteria bacterium]|nr:hypothetical protein [Gammaproteobacteria bacterium]